MSNDQEKIQALRVQVDRFAAEVVLAHSQRAEATAASQYVMKYMTQLNTILQNVCDARQEIIQSLEVENKQLQLANQSLEAKVSALAGKQSLPQASAPTTDVKPVIFGSHALKRPGLNAPTLKPPSPDAPEQSNDSQRGPKPR